jgi:hypothetical protein
VHVALVPDLSFAFAPAAAHGLSWNWTAIGTVSLAGVTLVTLLFTIYQARKERQQAAADRAAADQRLADERAAGEQRIRDERAHSDDVRRRERLLDNASALMQRVAVLQPYLPTVPGATLRGRVGTSPLRGALSNSVPGDDECRAAIASLRHGAWTEASMLGSGEAAQSAADRYRRLVRLVDETALGSARLPDRDIDSLRHYAMWVRITLRMLAASEIVPQVYGGSAESPLLGLAEHMPAWLPNPIPDGWNDETEVDAPLRRSACAQVGEAPPDPPPSQ